MFALVFENILHRLSKKLKNASFDAHMKTTHKWKSWKLNPEFWN